MMRTALLLDDTTARGRDGAVVLARVAIAFGAVAAVGALVSFLGDDQEWIPSQLVGFAPVVGVLTALCSWALASAATLIAGVRLVRRPREGRRSAVIALALLAPGAVLGTATLALVAAWLGEITGAFAGNRAEELARPVVGSYAELGSTVICDNGDGGEGLVNREPWYQVYIDAPNAVGAEEYAEQSLRDAGFSNVRPQTPDVGYGDEAAAESFAFSSEEGETAATVTVHPEGSVPLYCSQSSVEYGEEYRSPEDRVVVDVHISLPRND